MSGIEAFRVTDAADGGGAGAEPGDGKGGDPVDDGAVAASPADGGERAAGGATPPATAGGARPGFPPDEVLDLPGGLTFVRALLAVALLAALVDLYRVGMPTEPFPYSYPFLVGVVYLLVAVPLVRRVHDVFADVRVELVDLAGRRTMVGDSVDADLTPARIEAEMTRVLGRWFHPAVLVGGAAVGGTFGVAVVSALGVLGAYPHVLTAFAYAAAHGLFYGPLLGGVVLVRRVATEYIVDVDVLAPDGMGGYRAVGDALVSLLTYAVVLVTLDFAVLSSVSFLEEPLFRAAVAGLYGAMLATFVALTAAAVVAIRNRLLALRDRKVAALREEFEAVEETYWDKRRRGEDTRVEAADLRTMRAMFSELDGMSLWPLNVYAVLKLAASVGTSVVVFAIKRGLTALPL